MGDSFTAMVLSGDGLLSSLSSRQQQNSALISAPKLKGPFELVQLYYTSVPPVLQTAVIAGSLAGCCLPACSTCVECRMWNVAHDATSAAAHAGPGWLPLAAALRLLPRP
jgi:hypothetical protein